MRIANLTRYGPLAASTRQRFNQYIPFLENEGFEIENWPLFDDAYLKSKFAGDKVKLSYIFSRYFRRLKMLSTSKHIDVIWVNYELFPFMPGAFEKLVKVPSAKIVVDMDDAIFHNYDCHTNPLVRLALSNKLAPLLRNADLALCGNPYIDAYVSQYCDNTRVVPTILNTEHYRPFANEARNAASKKLRVGWLGSPSTWQDYMRPILPMLLDEAKRADAEIFAVGSGCQEILDGPLILKHWSENEEVVDIQSMDICIMPLEDTPWAQGKCGYKLIQYMACAKPVIASPVGINAEIVDHARNGFLARTEQDWRKSLRMLLGNASLRKDMGFAGRVKVEQEYALTDWGPKVASMLGDVARNKEL